LLLPLLVYNRIVHRCMVNWLCYWGQQAACNAQVRHRGFERAAACCVLCRLALLLARRGGRAGGNNRFIVVGACCSAKERVALLGEEREEEGCAGCVMCSNLEERGAAKVESVEGCLHAPV